MLGFGESLKDNWTVIMEAPWAFITFALLFSSVGFWFGRFFLNEKIQGLEERVKLRDDTISKYKENLSGASPEEAFRMVAELERRLDAIEPRYLSPEQLKIISEHIGMHVGFIGISKDMASAESVRVHAQIENLFRQKRWQVQSSQVMGMYQQTKSGIIVTTMSGDSFSKDAQLVLEALDKAGVDYDLNRRPTPHEVDQSFEHPTFEILFTNSFIP